MQVGVVGPEPEHGLEGPAGQFLMPSVLGPGAVEEIVRYASPVVFMRRTLTRDNTMNGQDYRKDDKVVLYYYSANRDEDVFGDPERFDITRSPNPHVGFGGAGRHYCLGANLARLESNIALTELMSRLSSIEVDEARGVERVHSVNVRGFAHLPVQVVAR